jgi:hypothetical protein
MSAGYLQPFQPHMPTIRKKKHMYFENKKINKKGQKNIGAKNLALIIGKSISQLIGIELASQSAN